MAYIVGVVISYMISNGIKFRARQTWMALILILCNILPYVTYMNDVSHIMKLSILPTLRILGSIWFAYELHWLYRISSNRSVLKRFLSCRFFELTAKISFTSFIVHFLVIVYEMGTSTYMLNFYSEKVNLINRMMSNLVVSHVIGLFFHLLVELPASNILRIVLTRK